MNCDTIVLYIYFVMFLCVYYERVLVVLYLNKDRKVTLGQKYGSLQCQQHFPWECKDKKSYSLELRASCEFKYEKEVS